MATTAKGPLLQIRPEEIKANIAVFAVAIALIILSSLFGGPWSFSALSDLNLKTVGLTIILLQVFYTMQSLYKVREDEWALRFRLEAFDEYVDPGLTYIPWILARLMRFPVDVVEMDIPGDPAKVWHGDTKNTDGKVPEGYIEPIRVTFAPRQEDKTSVDVKGKTVKIPTNDPYGERLTAEVEGAIGIKVTDPMKVVKKFGMRRPLAKIKSQLFDIVSSIIDAEGSVVMAAEANMRKTEIADLVKDALTKASEDWGVGIDFFRLKPFRFSHDLNAEADKAAQALSKKTATIRTSEGERDAAINKGEGAAQAEYLRLSAQAQGQRELAEVATQPGGQYAMGVQAAETIGRNARTVIIPDSNPLGIVQGIKSMIDATQPSKGTDPPPAEGSSPQEGARRFTPTPREPFKPRPPQGPGRGPGKEKK